jgi:putative tryptophan/tyrosine transport system substrate-binding protein
MNRREIIAGLGSAAVWPRAVRAQLTERVRRIGVLWANAENDQLAQSQLAALRMALRDLGWTEGHNLRFDYRWGARNRDDLDRPRRYAAELVAVAPDVIVTNTGGLAADLQRASRTVPIVFATANDPVGLGLVESIARPGTNATGLSTLEFSQSAKLLQLLREIAPRLMLVAVTRDPAFTGNFGVIQAMAGSLGIQVRPVDSREPAAIERGFAALAREPNGGVVVPLNTFAMLHRELIVKLAAQHRLPAVYGSRLFVAVGGLLSYGGVDADLYPRVAGYIDRILKGEKPADLPVQMATKYELVINLKTAKALGLTIPETLLATADEVIQ